MKIELETKITFTVRRLPIEDVDKGRCIKCAGRDFCGLNFPCPCKWDEQLEFFTKQNKQQ